MLHIYCGENKGKTTCAMGLAVRSAGHGNRVVIAQFLKGGNSGERKIFSALPNVTLLPVPETIKFIFTMTEEEKALTRAETTAMFLQAADLAKNCDLLVLDELCGALSTGMIPLQTVLDFLDSCPETLEVVITGRDPDPQLLERADYVTEMKKIKHPFDKGLNARKGVEW